MQLWLYQVLALIGNWVHLYEGGTVFIQGLVHFQDKWFLYYGTADSSVGVAVSDSITHVYAKK